MMILRDYQEEAKDAILEEWEKINKTLLVLPTGCHAKGEKVLKADGSVSFVEDIKVGDRLTGSDGTPRTVLHLTRGIGQLYKVTPVKGDPFIVTGDHKLTLVRTGLKKDPQYPCQKKAGEIIDVFVEEWRSWSKNKKQTHKLIRYSGIEYSDQKEPFPTAPYFLGFTVEAFGEGEYFGFTVDGDNRYLLSDFTITHNCGKTIVFSKLIEDCVRNGKRILVLAHRSELLDQAADKLAKATGLQTATEKAEETSIDSWFRVVVGSVQTLMREKRLNKFSKNYFDVIIVDEAHHCLADSYQRVLSYFDQAKVLGVTATPDRGDMKNLGEYFESLAYEYSLPKAIKSGFLVPIKALTIPLKLDLSKVTQQAGDFKAADLGSALDPYLEQIAEEMAEHCMDRKTVVFLPLIKTSQKFCAFLKEKGFAAAEVNGESQDRAEILKDFDTGKYNVLCNSMLLTEGWDCPSVDCIVVLRPTKIRSLYSQMVGRGTRLFPGKDHLLLLDFLWHTERHELCHPAHLISNSDEVARQMTANIEEAGCPIDISEAEEKAQSDVVAAREEALAKMLSEMKRRKRKLVDPLQFEMSIQAEDLSSFVPAFGWQMAPPSDGQKNSLEKLGILPDQIDNAGKASLLLERLSKRRDEGLTTPKQIRFLESRGFNHVGMWSFSNAKKLIDRIAVNGWKVPFDIDPNTYRGE